MDGYDIIANYFKEWIESQKYIDRFYVAVFEAKHAKYIIEPYNYFFELLEYDIDEGAIIWQFDWCEGENDITNLRFYSLSDIEYIIYDAENHELNNTCKKWFNVRR